MDAIEKVVATFGDQVLGTAEHAGQRFVNVKRSYAGGPASSARVTFFVIARSALSLNIIAAKGSSISTMTSLGVASVRPLIVKAMLLNVNCDDVASVCD